MSVISTYQHAYSEEIPGAIVSITVDMVGAYDPYEVIRAVSRTSSEAYQEFNEIARLEAEEKSKQ